MKIIQRVVNYKVIHGERDVEKKMTVKIPFR